MPGWGQIVTMTRQVAALLPLSWNSTAKHRLEIERFPSDEDKPWNFRSSKQTAASSAGPLTAILERWEHFCGIYRASRASHRDRWPREWPTFPFLLVESEHEKLKTRLKCFKIAPKGHKEKQTQHRTQSKSFLFICLENITFRTYFSYIVENFNRV